MERIRKEHPIVITLGRDIQIQCSSHVAVVFLQALCWYGTRCCASEAKLLNLAHSRATTDATGAGVGAAARCHAAHDGGGEECCEGEPEEGSDGLTFAAASGGATGDNVGEDVALRELLARCDIGDVSTRILTRLLQLRTRRYAAVAIPAMRVKRVQSASRTRGKMGWMTNDSFTETRVR